MLCSRDERIMNETDATIMLDELNNCLKEIGKGTYGVQAYMKKFLECVNAGAIRSLTFSDCTYEINADLIEKDNDVL